MPHCGERKYTTMMLYPAMNTLTKNVPNRYLLVNVVARRARQIAEDAEQEGIHLTEKPLQLMRDVVKIVEPGGHVLDPFAGSGSTILAALLEKYSATGIEVSEAYATLARERIEKAMKEEKEKI